MTPTTNQAMAHIDIEDTVATATETVATSNKNFIQTDPGCFNFCAGRGYAGAPDGEDTAVVGLSRPAEHVGD